MKKHTDTHTHTHTHTLVANWEGWFYSFIVSF